MKRAPILVSSLFALSALTATIALAQPEGEQPVNRRLQAAVDRMMANDKNNDGKLTRDELPARMAERIFDEADTDHDGALSREEVEAHLAARMPGGGARPGARPGGPEGDAPESGRPDAGEGARGFDGSMKQAGQAVRLLRRSQFAEATRESDLSAVQQLQEAMVAAKDTAAGVKMAPQAQEKYGDDVASYVRDMRLSILKTLRASLDLEQAILEGDAGAASSALQAVLESQKEGHTAFQEPD